MARCQAGGCIGRADAPSLSVLGFSESGLACGHPDSETLSRAILGGSEKCGLRVGFVALGAEPTGRPW